MNFKENREKKVRRGMDLTELIDLGIDEKKWDFFIVRVRDAADFVDMRGGSVNRQAGSEDSETDYRTFVEDDIPSVQAVIKVSHMMAKESFRKECDENDVESAAGSESRILRQNATPVVRPPPTRASSSKDKGDPMGDPEFVKQTEEFRKRFEK